MVNDIWHENHAAYSVVSRFDIHAQLVLHCIEVLTVSANLVCSSMELRASYVCAEAVLGNALHMVDELS